MRAAFAAVLCTGVLTATAAADPVDDYVRSQLKARNLPGLSLAVVKDGRIVKREGDGLASLELEAPATAQTVYELGSISKQFAADAILLLVEDGKVGLDDPLSTYVDGTPPAWAAVTIRHLLTHTTGFADFDTGNIGFSYRREYTAREFVRLNDGRTVSHGLGWFMDQFNGHPFGARRTGGIGRPPRPVCATSRSGGRQRGITWASWSKTRT